MSPRHGAIYEAGRCCVCDAIAHYRVGKRGFCKTHKALAFKARAVVSYQRDIQGAIAQRQFDTADTAQKKQDAHHASCGKQWKGFK